MKKKNNLNNIKLIDSIISKGSEFNGDFSIKGNLKIDGVVRGKVIAEGKVIIGINGIAICDIIANEIIIGGELRGNVVGINNIDILSTGNVKGNIITTALSIEEGVNFNGYCKINNELFKNDKFTLDEMLKFEFTTNNYNEKKNIVNSDIKLLGKDNNGYSKNKINTASEIKLKSFL